MSVKPSQAIAGRFTISDPSDSGSLVDADSTPTGALLENGVADGAVTVTITNISTGIYKWSCTIPSDYTAGTLVAIQITATLSTNSVGGIVWGDYVDTQYASNLAGSSYVEGTHALDQQATTATMADAVFDEAMSGHTTSGTAGAALQYVYWVEFEFIGGASTDKYRGCRWIKNGTRLTSGVTVPTIQVIDTDDGTDLIAETSMSEAGSSELFKYDATGAELTSANTAYKAVFTATIDGATRTYEQGFIRSAS